MLWFQYGSDLGFIYLHTYLTESGYSYKFEHMNMLSSIRNILIS